MRLRGSQLLCGETKSPPFYLVGLGPGDPDLMALHAVRVIEKLSINYPPETPIAVVKNAGYAEKEEVIESTLGTVLDQVGKKGPGSVYLIYVGNFLNHRYKSRER